ncbi:MAG: GTP 3',8-cyclase MoaA [Myxococcales bacterium]|nr:GTP 3',8-cyclase MoaA [Myxococcales bacterium]
MDSESGTPRDRLGRALRELRVSVTDRCNFRCTYCMPLEHYSWIPKREILSFEEITRLSRLFVRLGVDALRLTGGEPLLRKGLPELIAMLSAIEGLDEISLTTNATRLVELAEPLRRAGLRRINISLDTLDPARFEALTRRRDLDRVIAGIDRAVEVGLTPVKLNTVVQRGVNDDELVGLVRFAVERGLELRFIEFMDVGTANGWRLDQVVSRAEILQAIAGAIELEPLGRLNADDPAEAWRVRGSACRIGIIPSVTAPFCGRCSRARLTANGSLVTCLFAASGHDLKGRLRDGASDDELLDRLRQIWRARDDRYSEIRFSETGALARREGKLEMITLGG